MHIHMLQIVLRILTLLLRHILHTARLRQYHWSLLIWCVFRSSTMNSLAGVTQVGKSMHVFSSSVGRPATSVTILKRFLRNIIIPYCVSRVLSRQVTNTSFTRSSPVTYHCFLAILARADHAPF